MKTYKKKKTISKIEIRKMNEKFLIESRKAMSKLGPSNAVELVRQSR
jgi:hypothetical protein